MCKQYFNFKEEECSSFVIYHNFVMDCFHTWVSKKKVLKKQGSYGFLLQPGLLVLKHNWRHTSTCSKSTKVNPKSYSKNTQKYSGKVRVISFFFLLFKKIKK